MARTVTEPHVKGNFNERTRGLYKLLELAHVYDAVMGVLAPPRRLQDCIRQFIAPAPGMRILDVGAGTSTILEHLPRLDYVGLEPNPDYVETAKERYAGRGEFLVGGVGDMADVAGKFDRVIAWGVLHHLSSGLATEFFAKGAQVLRPGGRIVTMDGGYTPGQSPLSRWVVSRDRGRHVRPLSEYTDLARSSGLPTRTYYATRLLRIPYAHVVTVTGDAA